MMNFKKLGDLLWTIGGTLLIVLLVVGFLTLVGFVTIEIITIFFEVSWILGSAGILFVVAIVLLGIGGLLTDCECEYHKPNKSEQDTSKLPQK